MLPEAYSSSNLQAVLKQSSSSLPVDSKVPKGLYVISLCPFQEWKESPLCLVILFLNWKVTKHLVSCVDPRLIWSGLICLTSTRQKLGIWIIIEGHNSQKCQEHTMSGLNNHLSTDLDEFIADTLHPSVPLQFWSEEAENFFLAPWHM